MSAEPSHQPTSHQPTSPRFFTTRGKVDIHHIQHITQGELVLAPEGPQGIDSVAPLRQCLPHQLTYIRGTRYLDDFADVFPGVLVVRRAFAERYIATEQWQSKWQRVHRLYCDDPEAALAAVTSHLYTPSFPVTKDVSPHAVIDPLAKIGDGCAVAPGVVVGSHATIGDGCTINANATIGAGVMIGDHCWIGEGVHINYCVIGKNVRIRAGATIGNRGMGFTTDDHGKTTDIPQIGGVAIGDDVEIGSNATIDRGKFGDTVVGSGCRIDNQVQIAHNVRIGERCIILANTTIAGSVVFEDRVVCGGLVGFNGHITIGKGARILGGSMVVGNLPACGQYAMAPAMPMKSVRRIWRSWLRTAKDRPPIQSVE